jgi:hypothetical protein
MTGPTKDDKVSYQGVTYPMPGNGFARDTEFSVVEADDSHAVFLLEEAPATFAHYPFPVCLPVTYTRLSDGYSIGRIRAKRATLWFTFGCIRVLPRQNGRDTDRTYRIVFLGFGNKR